MQEIFRIRDKISLRPGFTISRKAGPWKGTSVTWFSLGQDTDISQESYDQPRLLLGEWGKGVVILGKEKREENLCQGRLLLIPGEMLCGLKTESGLIYTEIVLTEKENIMNNFIKAGEAVELKELLPYEEGSIVNLDIVRNKNLKYVLMAFDEGTGLDPHRAPGDALLTALEGEALVDYEGEAVHIRAGESIRFAKNGLHSVKAISRFKMSLLLVLE